MATNYMVVSHGGYNEHSGLLARTSVEKLRQARDVIKSLVQTEVLAPRATILAPGTVRHKRAAELVASAFKDSQVIPLDNEMKAEVLPRINRPHPVIETGRWLSLIPTDRQDNSTVIAITGNQYIKEILGGQAAAAYPARLASASWSTNPLHTGRYTEAGEQWEPEIGDIPIATVFDSFTQRFVPLELEEAANPGPTPAA